MTTRIAVIGAGIAGLHLARTLAPHRDVTVFEKARGVSGRMSTRYADPYQFDHGAQYFTARDTGFQNFLRTFLEDGTIADWTPKVVTLARDASPYKRDWFEPHYVATPRMNRLCQFLAEGLNILVSVEIRSLAREAEGWMLIDGTGLVHGPFDWVVSSAPAPQSARLLPADFDGQEALQRVVMSGCYTLMIGLPQGLPWAWDVAVVKDSPLAWIAANHGKPGRAKAPASLVVHTTNAWAEAHIDEDIPAMQALLVTELQELTGLGVSGAGYLTTHRWRYASVEQAAGADYLIDPSQRLAACGDWCLGGRVEAAWRSADALANHLLAFG